VLDVGAFDGFYSVLAEARGARRVVAVDNEQYVGWVRARFGVTLEGGFGFQAIARLVASRVEYRRMDALDVRELGQRFDVALCFGILHRVTDPVALLRALTGVLAPDGELVLETYGSRLPTDAPVIEVHEPGDVYARDEFVYWASRRRVCGDWGGSLASTRSTSSTGWRSTATRGFSRCYERPADRALRSRPAVGAQAATSARSI
jgi:SAM-dependent methyltransferase